MSEWQDSGIRGSGRTSEQMRGAPEGAVFVAAGPVDYSVRLARHLRRVDLKVVPMDPLAVRRAVIGTRRQIVLDHALPVRGTPQEWMDHTEITRMVWHQASRQPLPAPPRDTRDE